MSTFRLEMTCDSAAFSDGAHREIGQLLLQISQRIHDKGLWDDATGVIRDSNGNTVGNWEYMAPEKEEDRDE